MNVIEALDRLRAQRKLLEQGLTIAIEKRIEKFFEVTGVQVCGVNVHFCATILADGQDKYQVDKVSTAIDVDLSL